jgi:hypothetical protein
LQVSLDDFDPSPSVLRRRWFWRSRWTLLVQRRRRQRRNNDTSTVGTSTDAVQARVPPRSEARSRCIATELTAELPLPFRHRYFKFHNLTFTSAS